MTWEHYTIIALWVLGACASASAANAHNGSGNLLSFLLITLIWPGVIAFGVGAGLWDRWLK